jgi:hypothetical protein
MSSTRNPDYFGKLGLAVRLGLPQGGHRPAVPQALYGGRIHVRELGRPSPALLARGTGT